MMDVSAVIIFHNEDLLASFAVQSLIQGVKAARERGILVEVCAVLDRPSALTMDVVTSFSRCFDQFDVVDFGDLGSSRNFGRTQSTGKYVTFFDGDDLWGDQWIYRAYEQAELEKREKSIYHPELIHYFTAEDYLVQAQGYVPNPSAKGYFFLHVDSDAASFDPRTIFFNNLWTANSFALRSVYDAVPYLHVDRNMGFGVEDWAWNAHTLAQGYTHSVVRETVHNIRLRRVGSLSQQNVKERLIPPLYAFARALESL